MAARARVEYGHSMRRRPSPLLSLLLLAPLAAAHEPGPLERVEVRRSRGLLVVTAGAKAVPASTKLVARLRSGDRTALETPVAVTGGALEVELLTTRALLPGTYTLEVGEPGARPALSSPVVIGDAAEAKASAARMDAWYLAAATALRDLSTALERRGAYHSAQVEVNGELHRARFESFLEGWSAALRAARMDLASLERRLLLPPRPEVVDALRGMVAALEARAQAWVSGMHSRGAAPPQEGLLGPAGVLLEALAAHAADEGAVRRRLDQWGPGTLWTPPAGSPAGTGAYEVAKEGVYTDLEASFRLELPAGWRALEADRKPEERLRLTSKDEQVSLVVEVQPLPDAVTPEVLAAAVETLAWEGYLSYKRLESAPIVEGGVQVGVRVTFEADVATGDRTRVHVVQTSRWPTGAEPGKGRIYHALVVRHVGAAPPADGVDELVARSFRPL